MTEQLLKHYKIPPFGEMAASAETWLLRSWGIVPIQPNSKELVGGFGPHLARLSADQVEEWFRFRKCNLAVIAPQNGVILDFDLPELYERFCHDSPAASRSYSERSPAGGAHVFIETAESVIPSNYTPADGLELKRLVVVYPSVVAGRPYQVIGGKIERVDLQEALRGFATVKPTPPLQSARPVPVGSQIGGNSGVFSRAKAAWPIERFMMFFAPKVKLSGKGDRWRVGVCPWHPDHNPSLWIDIVHNTWGCHACPAGGNVIDWWAMTKGITPLEAAKDLVDYAGSVRFEA